MSTTENKPANKRRGEVALHEAGDGVVLRFSNDAMERLHGAYGESYIDHIIAALAKAHPKVYRDVLSCMIEAPSGRSVDVDERPWGLSWEKLNLRIVDAMFLALYDQTFEERQAHLEAEADKEFEKSKANPRKAAALLSKLYSELGSLPASVLTKSES